MKFTHPTLSDYRRQKMMKAAQSVLESQHAITQQHGGLLHFIQGDAEHFTQMRHYPCGDRIDYTSGSQYFYHCHREDMQTEEHGHFHTFQRYKQISKRRKPTPLDDWDLHLKNPMTHLIAISLNRYGLPCRLFTVNRWVTSEVLYPAQHVAWFSKKYSLDMIEKAPEWQLMDNWVSGMMQLFLPQIIWLQEQRDLVHAQLTAQHKGKNHYLNKEIEELTSLPITLESQIGWLSDI